MKGKYCKTDFCSNLVYEDEEYCEHCKTEYKHYGYF